MSKIVSLNLSDEEIINGIKSHDDKAATALYSKHKGYCMRFMDMMYWDNDTNQDIYQDAIMVFINKIRDNTLILRNTRIQTYLNTVCRNQILVRLKQKNKPIPMDIGWEDDIMNIEDVGLEENEIISERVKIILDELEIMKLKGPDCFKLLKSIFYENRKLEAITSLLNYKNTRSVITQSYKCRERLKKQVFKRLEK
jgi:DNA-directed RNA polymerase specialized sigma24 family protein